MLELYFRFNAYPTYADRRILAEKTGMLTRQITVWVSCSMLIATIRQLTLSSSKITADGPTPRSLAWRLPSR